MRTALLLALVLAGAAPHAGAAEALYPDLMAWKKLGTYLYDARVVIQGGRRRLQFSSAFANIGHGPFELRGEVQPDGTTTAYQRVYNDDGTFNDYLVGTFVFAGHADHNHFHYAEFAAYRLRAVTSGGGVGGVVAASDKVGFAMWDVEPYDTSLPGAPGRPVYERPEGNEDLREGISIGWADVYDRELFDQDIDVTAVPDGEYWLENEMDPDHRLRDGNVGNNITRVKIRLTGGDVAFLPEGGAPPPPAPPPQKLVGQPELPSPNPWRSDLHAGRPMRVRVANGGVVKIFSLNGEHVCSVPSAGGVASWNLVDEAGGAVGSGFYFYSIEEPGEAPKHGRIVIVR